MRNPVLSEVEGITYYAPPGNRNSTNSYVRIYQQIMQNKPKVKSVKINVSSFVTSKYELMGQLVIQTNKPKTNPIASNSNNERFCVDKEFYDYVL
jgi:hypothetical protein